MTPKSKPTRILQYQKSPNSCGYNWDGGNIAFGDPFELIGNVQKKRAAYKVRYNDEKKMRRDASTSTENRKLFHLKHG